MLIFSQHDGEVILLQDQLIFSYQISHLIFSHFHQFVSFHFCSHLQLSIIQVFIFGTQLIFSACSLFEQLILFTQTTEIIQSQSIEKPTFSSQEDANIHHAHEGVLSGKILSSDVQKLTQTHLFQNLKVQYFDHGNTEIIQNILFHVQPVAHRLIKYSHCNLLGNVHHFHKEGHKSSLLAAFQSYKRQSLLQFKILLS